MIEAAAVVSSVSEMSTIVDSAEPPKLVEIKTESQARALSKVEPAKRAEVLQTAAASGARLSQMSEI